MDYKHFVADLVKDGDDIIKDLTKETAHLWHMATGVSGEAGELLDAVKKHVVYGKPRDTENIIEELGDLEFYMEGIRQIIGVDREYILGYNQDKLSRRYSELKYSDQAAQERKDKQ
jgi:NTP pyrophosphatase (non-canonical NTP hydrolase)